VTALAALTGAGTGLGLVLILAGWRGVELPAARRRALTRVRTDRLVVRAATAVGAGVLVGAVTSWPVAALLAALAAAGLPRLLSGRAERAATIARVEALAGWAEMLRDTMAGAAGLEQAIQASAPIAPTAIREPVVRLAARLERDQIVPALRGFADELADPTADLIVAALILASEHQARRLGDLLGTLATAARDQASMRLRVEAGRARTRTSVKVIVGAATALAVGLAVLNRGYLTPYDTPLGQLVLAAVGALFTAAFAWLSRMTRPTAPERTLAPSVSGARP
jgi:Flp pilus assembly protein TadB